MEDASRLQMNLENNQKNQKNVKNCFFQKNIFLNKKSKEHKDEEWKELLSYGNYGNENCNPLLGKNNKFIKKSKVSKFNIF